MSETPKAKGIRDMHPEDITISEEKLYLFLTGWLGGPSLYTDKYGHPRLRSRHLPFAIGIEERESMALLHGTCSSQIGIRSTIRRTINQFICPNCRLYEKPRIE